MRSTLVFAMAALAGACTLGPDYSRPPIETPAAYRVQPAAARQTANTAWWKAFGDPVLDKLIDEALAHNQNLAIATANIERAAGMLTQAHSALFPQIGYNGNATREKYPEGRAASVVPNVPDLQTSYQALLGASWEIDLWGRIRRLSEAARANLLATDAARDGVILSLVAAVAQSYVSLRGYDQQLVIARETLATYGESLRLFKLQFQYGQISQMNVAQVQSQYENAAAQIPQIKIQIAQTENALSVLLGRNPVSIPRGKSLDALTAPAIPEGLPSQLLERRPDLVEAEQQLIAANAQIGAARALYFPTISLSGALGGTSRELSDLFSGPARVWNFAGQLTGPIFTFGAVSGQVAQAEAGQKAAVANYRLSIQNAFADVDNALSANQQLGDQLAAQQRLVAALEDYARFAHLQYNGGYAPYSTVLQAEQSLFPAQLALASVRVNLLNSAANLYKATGGGWVAIAARQTDTGEINDQSVKTPLF